MSSFIPFLHRLRSLDYLFIFSLDIVSQALNMTTNTFIQMT